VRSDPSRVLPISIQRIRAASPQGHSKPPSTRSAEALDIGGEAVLHPTAHADQAPQRWLASRARLSKEINAAARRPLIVGPFHRNSM